MLLKAALLWIGGLVTAVPYAVYYLLFQAPREQYALLITFVLFWIFGYWSVAGPLLAIVKVRAVMRRIEQARNREELIALLQTPDATEAAVDFIAAENHIPRFLARRVHGLLLRRGRTVEGRNS